MALPAFCNDDDLGYAPSATRFDANTGLRFDEAYRLAHLPRIAPQHPLAIASREGAPYRDGVHAEMFSLVLHVPHDALDASSAFKSLQAEMRAASFAPKIAWDLLPRRQNKLHATICGGLGPKAPAFESDALAQIEPFWVELRGLFSGNVNLGRLYLKAYPEKRGGRNVIQSVQSALGRRLTDLYLVGLYNFVDELTLAETEELGRLIARWRDEPILHLQVDRLRMLGAHDDLVLQSRFTGDLRLGRAYLLGSDTPSG